MLQLLVRIMAWRSQELIGRGFATKIIIFYFKVFGLSPNNNNSKSFVFYQVFLIVGLVGVSGVWIFIDDGFGHKLKSIAGIVSKIECNFFYIK